MPQRRSRREENFGVRLAFAIFDLLATYQLPGLVVNALSRAFGIFFFVTLVWQSHQVQQQFGLIVTLHTRNEGDIHSLNPQELVRIQFGKHQLLS